MEGELNFLTTAKKTLLEDKGVYSSDFSRWIKSSLPYHVSLPPEKAITTIVLHVHKFRRFLGDASTFAHQSGLLIFST